MVRLLTKLPHGKLLAALVPRSLARHGEPPTPTRTSTNPVVATLRWHLRFAFAALSLCLGMAPAASGQNIQYTGKLADKTKRSDFRVDPSTLGLNVEIPLGGYPGRGAAGLPVTLNYSSKVWRMKYAGPGDASGGFTTLVAPAWGEDTAAGWTSTLGLPKLIDDPQELYDSMGFPTSDCSNHCRVVRKVTVQMPDGSTHVLRHTSPIALPTDSRSGTYLAADGSGLRYEYDSKTLYLPDGSRYVLLSRASTPTTPTAGECAAKPTRERCGRSTASTESCWPSSSRRGHHPRHQRVRLPLRRAARHGGGR